MRIKAQLFLTLGLTLASTAAWACTNPAGATGDVKYITNYNVMAYCDGSDWVAMLGTIGGSGSGATLLNELDDVSTGGAADGQALVFNSGSWAPASVQDSRIGTLSNGDWCSTDGAVINCNNTAPLTPSSSINDLADVLASGATEGSILAYSGGDWVVSTTTTGADNLGNHTASQTLNLNGNWLSGDGDAEGLQVLADGTVSASGIVSATAFYGDGSNLTGISTGSADQVISGTTNITTNENSSISFTTAGTERMILTDSGQLALGEGTADPSAILDISTTTQGVLPPRLTSTQRDNISNPAEGLMVFNTEEGAYQFWAGSSWVNLGGGIPNGTIAAFATASCPSGWSEYTPARGRFLRGIDPTGTLDPDGVRTAGSTQGDMIGQHQHLSPFSYNPGTNPYGFEDTLDSGVAREVTDQSESSDDQPYTSNFGGAETRPVNVAVTFCEYTGGAPVTATPSGGAGEVQFADGSGGLSSNASFIYTGGNLGINTATPQTTLEVGGTISTTSLFVNGTEITGGGSGGGSNSFEDFAEQSPDPASPAGDTMRLFARDDGSGNTELVAKNSTANETVIAPFPGLMKVFAYGYVDDASSSFSVAFCGNCSVSRINQGDYSVTFDSPRSSVDYIVIGNTINQSDGIFRGPAASNLTTNGFNLSQRIITNGNDVDEEFQFIVFAPF